MPILTETYEGVPEGMNLALPAQELSDGEARYLQDILLHRPGETVRRGPLTPVTGMATTRKPASGLVGGLDPLGNFRVAVLFGDNTEGKLGLYSADRTTITELNWNGVLPTTPANGAAQAYRIVDAKASLLGGTCIGTSSQYDADSPVQTLAFWHGANKADYSTGTITTTRDATTKIGATQVTGSGTSWLSAVAPGMFLFADTDDPYTQTLIGVVKSVESNTSLTLASPALHVCTGKAYTLTSIKGFSPRVVTGRITCATTAATVTGALTKFRDQGMHLGTWVIYRASDFAFVGKVQTVTNNTSITLAANAAVTCNNDSYIGIRTDADYSINTMAVAERKVGFLTAIYSERQWYANLGQDHALTSRLWFSDTSHPEAVDLSTFNGDFIDVGSSHGPARPIRALMPAYNALLVLKDNETFGVFGSTKTTFQVRKIEDDGAISGMSVQPYGGGVIWAGKNGIYFYDGIQAENMTEPKLGDYYKNAIRTFDPEQYRMWSMIERNHYFLFVEKFTPNRAIVKGTTSETPDRITFCINMVTRAISVLTNVGIRGAVVLPADTGQATWFVVNAADGTGRVCDGTALFDDYGIDPFACDDGVAGPRFYFESKKYKVGDSLRKKLFKQLAIHYLAQGSALKIDTVVGLNNVGKTSNTTFPATVYTWDTLASAYATWDLLASTIPTWDGVINAVFRPKRIKFLKRNQHLAFRIYEADPTISQRVVLGPFSLGFKLQRPGRV